MDKIAILIAGMIMVGVLLIAVSMLTVSTAPPIQNTPQNFQAFVSAELDDECATPEGYTDEEWQQHMSHHPDRYSNCLE